MRNSTAVFLLAAVLSACTAEPKVVPPAGMSAQEAQSLKEFEEEILEYVKLKKDVSNRLPPLKDNATPDEIAAHRKALAQGISEHRREAEPGDLLESGSGLVILRIIESEFSGPNGKELKAAIVDQMPTQVPLRVNDAYDDTAPLSFVPPALLLKLPQLPEHLQYRFVDRHLILLDVETHLILDIEKNVIPRG